MRPPSASSAYRNRPSLERASSRSPGMPSTEMPAVASSSDKEPSEAIAKRETAPSAKFVVKANRSSGVTTAQQISLRPLPTEEVRATSDPSSIAYDDAAAAPFSAPKASVTTSVPPEVNAKPYGVGPSETISLEDP